MTTATKTSQTKTQAINNLSALSSYREKRLLTLDSNIFIAALKKDETYTEQCADVLSKVPKEFVLTEPSLVYQEVCGTLARKISLETAMKAKKQLDLSIDPKLLTSCDKKLCSSAFTLCSKYEIYAIDALYLEVALANHAVLVSLDKKDFIDKVKNKKSPIEAYTVSEFPY
jgi:predicted nucleic acid-binding protein